jgi:hypothetical protein
MCIVGKYQIYLYELYLKTGSKMSLWQAFLAGSTASAN